MTHKRIEIPPRMSGFVKYEPSTGDIIYEINCVRLGGRLTWPLKPKIWNTKKIDKNAINTLIAIR